MTEPSVQRRVGPIVVAVLAGAAQLFVGFCYLTSGLVVPGPWLFLLWVVWLVLAAVLVRLAVRASWWTPAVPVVAAAVLVLTLVAGDTWLGWTA